MSEPAKCPACARLLTEHRGLMPTCQCLQMACRALEQLVATPNSHAAITNAKAVLKMIRQHPVTAPAPATDPVEHHRHD